ncbi:MAG: S9 family peptidase [Actinobacteria bacterium]|nr:S9 family peptidase [Actinomycetota bacterium]
MPETDTDADLTTAAPADRLAGPATPFHDLDAYVALRRQGAIALSPDGSRLVAVATELNADKTKYVTALWDLDPSGDRQAHRLTRSAPGEGAPRILPDNSVLFVSKRPDPAAAKPADDEKPALWLLPAGTGEPRQVAAKPGGVGAVHVARGTGRIVLTATVFERTTGPEQDADKRTARKDAKVSAILHDRYPVRYWDHDLGPEQPRLFACSWRRSETPASSTGFEYDDVLELSDVTPDAGRALADAQLDVSPDGSFVVTTWSRVDGHTGLADGLVRIDLDTGQRTELAAAPRVHFGLPAISPDGSRIAFIRMDYGTADEPHRESLWVMPSAGGDARRLPLDGDLRPTELAWSPDGAVLYVAADESGRSPVFALDMATGQRRRLAADGAYTSLQVHPDGQRLFAVRSSYTDPGTIVALDVLLQDQQSRELCGPAPRPDLPGTLTEVTATAADGTTIRSFLALPDGADAARPAPLLLWVHGGPVNSWNAWSWRWCPWLLVAQGYAVLLPDPALSTGYGDVMIERGWGRWGETPFTDVIAATDAVLAERDDLDPTRTAMMGGSFGGYMANWIAGHTDRFKAIVSHASLWDLPAFGGTTDEPSFWRDEMSPAMRAGHTPSAAAAAITTPMLVIHGDKDYRVPIGEGLRLWWDLLDHADPTLPLPHRFLYFPDENHWVLTPNHAKVWYQTVRAFLAWHVLGEEFVIPDLL